MNFFDEQVVTYSVLLKSLRAYAKKPDGSLKAAEIRPHDGCALGRWFESERAKYGSLADFSKLDDHHARFHQAAADMVVLIDEAPAKAEAALDDIVFKKTFANLLKAMAVMKAKVG